MMDLRTRQYRFFCVTGLLFFFLRIGMFLFTEPQNLANIYTVAISFLAVCLLFGFFLIQKYPVKSELIITVTLLYIILLHTPLLWFDGYRVQGTPPFFVFIYSLFIAFTTEGRKRLLLCILYFAVVMILFYYDWTYISGRSENDSYMYFASLIIVYMALSYLFSTTYDHENLTIKKRTFIDPLTELYNRRYFNIRFASILTEPDTRRNDSCLKLFSLIMIDLDNFKQVNDNYGHKTGDAVLKSTSAFLLDQIRDSDDLCRIGGDEFLIILPNKSKEDCVNIAKRIQNKYIKRDEYSMYNVSLSIGIIDNREFGICAGDDLLELVDKRMYISKENGKGKIVAGDSANDIVFC